ncbi:MAG: tRNA (adenosine(37)-N6)-threonylcarbamoyltransferase complex dimerization subunit type 1 TsaB [Proteobacteria bacterium]|nr:tRNA (adenosine(37)-N6)-threonylcarbamoyltransferase complex dimerization subunit type 1 TsaB [Pseudomonadota bacterium]
MNLLAFDTCFAACSVAVIVDGVVAAHRATVLHRGHAEALLPMVAATLSDSGLAWDGIAGLGVTVGPGTFTGMRAGLAAARGIALVRRIPVAGFSSLHALAAGAVRSGAVGPADPMLATADARRGEVYVQVFGPGVVPLGQPELVAAADVRAPVGAIVLGTGAGSVLAAHPALQSVEHPAHPDAADVAALAAAAMASPGWRDPGPPQPLYIRAPHVTKQKKSG